MKRFIFFGRLYTLLVFVLPVKVTAQVPDPFPNYVVIGAFAHQKNAIHFTEDANKLHFPARFEMNPNRNLYYVFVLTTSDREYALAEAVRFRAETKYFDTWVYSGVLGQNAITNEGIQAQDLDPVTRNKIESVNVEQKISGAEIKTGGYSREETETIDSANKADSHEVAETKDQPDLTAASVPTDNAPVKHVEDFPKRVSTAALSPEEIAGKDFYFQLYRTDNREWVDGEVDAIDFEKSRKMATYTANKPVKVVLPSGKSKQVSFVCQVFGYRKQQKEFDPENPADEYFLDEKGNLVIPFELMRLQKGDIAIMYNVFFFKDAAVMRPESRYEVNNLLDLLTENPSYKIIIHGHTNGKANGKIVRMEQPGNFYSLSGTKEGFGSAKKLSEERALVMKQFLVSSGVSGERMEVKAWGGKKPIHDKNSARAQENVRVEIEILSE